MKLLALFAFVVTFILVVFLRRYHFMIRLTTYNDQVNAGNIESVVEDQTSMTWRGCFKRARFGLVKRYRASFDYDPKKRKKTT